MIRYDRLLVPVDGSDAANTATQHALALAAATDAAVDVLHVVAGGRDADARSSREARGKAMLAEVAAQAAEAGVEVDRELRSGTPHEAILEYAAERGAHLVVMGRHGSGTVGERLLGSVTDRVLRVGTYPVLTAWAAERGQERIVDAEAILLPTDGSEPAEVAGEHAAALAALSGATVHVVSVADVAAAGGLFDAGGVSDAFVENLEADARRAAERLADSLRAATDAPVQTGILQGRPGPTLESYVHEAGIDAVVMGAHGRSGVERLLLGSVTQRLLRTVEVPVLVVPGDR